MSTPSLAMLSRAARSAPILLADEERELARRARGGDDAAFARLLCSHLRLVLAIARDFVPYGLPVDELVSEGMLGLCEAARRFEPDRGPRLAAYAAVWIRAYMRRYTTMYRRIVRTPSSRHGRRLLAQLRRTQRDLAQACSAAPDVAAVARALDVDVRDVEEMEAALGGRDIPCGDDVVGSEIWSEAQSPELLLARAEEHDLSARALERGLDRLTQRERQIVQRRHLTGDVASFAAIGRDMGLSRERVRQLEQRAQHKLRDAVLGS